MKKPIITGNTTIAEGDVLNLTCRVESFPLSRITWTKLNTNLNNEPNTDLQCNDGSATILISNVKEEHSGQYICSVQYLDTTVAVFADITVTCKYSLPILNRKRIFTFCQPTIFSVCSVFPKVLKTSGCKIQSEVLSCLCVSEGSPLPTIRWPLLKNYAEYSVFTSISKDTINSTFTLPVKDHNSTTVECVSSNEIGETRSNLTCDTDTSSEQGTCSQQNIFATSNDYFRASLYFVQYLFFCFLFFFYCYLFILLRPKHLFGVLLFLLAIWDWDLVSTIHGLCTGRSSCKKCHTKTV